ncbi:MAG: uracil phosphoribosyltransferase [Bacteroidales bacterium]
MKIIQLSHEKLILNQYIKEIRDKEIQKDSIRFRRNLERIGEVFALEISRKLSYSSLNTQTPLGNAETKVLDDKLVMATILRAGLPMHQGMLNIYDRAENAFVSAYRRHHKDGSFEVKVEYISSPNLDGKVLIICDPMLATGHSMVHTYKALLNKGKPLHTHIACILASTSGVEEIKRKIQDDNISLWIGALDEELTAQAYIVPGLGDAGDLAYGIKEE